MSVTVKKIVLWRKEVENQPGTLANALAPLANAGADIHVVMTYRFPGAESKAAIELYPVTGKKSGLQPERRDLARQPSRLCWSRAITGRALAMQSRRPLPMQESTWIFS